MKDTIARMLFLAGSFGAHAYGSQLILNGGFETGTLADWSVATESGSEAGSDFFVTALTTTPLTGLTTVGAETGSYYAISDSTGSAASLLYQGFTVPVGVGSVVLSYSLFVNSGGSGTPTPAEIPTAPSLDFNTIPSQFGIISLISGSTNLFSTTTGDLMNFYEGVGTADNPNPYTNYSYNITSLVSGGGTYYVRIGEVNNVDTLNLGVDNVSVVYTPTSAPEPGSTMPTLGGFVGIAILLWRRQAKA
jgi:hypothetical protein